jgi:hypothetical protein
VYRPPGQRADRSPEMKLVHKKRAAGIEGVKKSDFLAKTTMTAALPNLF